METDIFPYTATSISILARFIFMYLLYTKKSTNIYSLSFCILNIVSSSLWIKYCIEIENTPMLARSAIDIGLLTISSIYIIHNRIMDDTSNNIENELKEVNEKNKL